MSSSDENLQNRLFLKDNTNYIVPEAIHLLKAAPTSNFSAQGHGGFTTSLYQNWMTFPDVYCSSHRSQEQTVDIKWHFSNCVIHDIQTTAVTSSKLTSDKR